MIIFGFRSRESTAGSGTFACPRCQSPQSYRLMAVRRWFTLYFLPVIPLSRVGQYVQCDRCAGTFSDEILNGFPPSGEPVLTAILADSPEPLSDGKIASGGPTARPTSGLATLSLVMGLLSPIFLCACGLSLITSLTAVISGHVALVRIGRANGMLDGRGIALGGLVLGYMFIPLSALSVYFFANFADSVRRGFEAQRQMTAADLQNPSNGADARLREAELAILTSSRGIAQGNSPEAQLLAKQFAADMQTLRETLFTKRDRGLSLTNDQFVTYCELHEERCAFVVHVPDYRKFEDEAKESLAALAWTVAQRTAATKLKPGASLAVGLKGTLLYGAVMVGQVQTDGDEQMEELADDRDALLAFFAPPSDRSTAPAEPVPALPAQTDLAGGPTTPVEPSAPPTDAFSPPPGRQVPQQPTTNEQPSPTNMPVPPTPGPAPTPFPFPGPPGPFNPPSAPQPFPIMPGPNAPVPPPIAGPRSRSDSPPVASDRSQPRPEATEVEVGERPVHRFPDLGWSVKSLAFSPDSRWIAVGKMDRTLLLFEVESGRKLSTQTDLMELGEITALAFTRNGEQLYIGGGTGVIQLWNVEPSGTLKLAQTLTGHNRAVRCLVAREDVGLLISGGEDKRLMWQQTRGSKNMRASDIFQGAVEAIFLPPQGVQVLASDGRQLAWVDMRKSTVERTLELSRSRGHAVALSADGARIACSEGYAIRVWETETGKELKKLDSVREIHWSLQFTPDGKRLISGSRGKAHLWDLEQDQARTLALGGVLYVQTLAVSPDGRWLAAIPSAAGQSLQIFSLAEPKVP